MKFFSRRAEQRLPRWSIPPGRAAQQVSLLQMLVKAAWGALFFTLPLTSSPYFPSGLGGKTLVRPLAAYPLLILLLLVTLPRFFKRRLPRTFLPLLAFLLAAVFSSLISLSADIEALRGVTLISRFVRSLATLALGAAFYFTIALLPETWEDLRFSLRWLYAGFAAALAWGSLQAVYVVHYSPAYFKLLNQLQSFISTRKLFATRISGMSYEPKWFAEQLCLLVIPWLLGAILSKLERRSTPAPALRKSAPALRKSAPGVTLQNTALNDWLFSRFPRLQRFLQRSALSWITLEWLLLAWTCAVLLFTFSRTGLVILGALLVISFLIFRYSARLFPTAATSSPLGCDDLYHKNAPLPASNKKKTPKTRIFIEVTAVICGLIAVFVLVGSQNPYFSRFWRYWTEAKQRNRTYLEYIAFDQRFTYWQTAFIMFETYPLAGVGLGNYAFYFDEMLPDRLYRQAEIIRQTTPEEGRDRLITPKNLFARLLAETGLLGSATFIAFLLAIAGCVGRLWRHDQLPLAARNWTAHSWAIGGALALIASFFVMFSMDSFARPEMWVVFGLITAAAHLHETTSAEVAQHG